MRFHKVVRISFQQYCPLDDESWHSILISILRGMAAFIVAIAHLRAATYPGLHAISNPPLWFKGLAFVSGFAHQAVLVFFVISGWLVGGSLLNRLHQPQAFANYAIDRMTRLWTVLIPSFVLSLAFAAVIGAVRFGGIDFSLNNQYSAITFAGNLIGLQRVLLPDFGGNFPLWSLANETWYYLLFPLLVYACTLRRYGLRIVCAAAAFGICFLLPVDIVAYFLIWLLGVGFSRLRIDCSRLFRWCWALLLLGTASYFRLFGELDAFNLSTLGQDLVCSFLYLILLSSLQFKAPAATKLKRPLQKGGKFFAEFSFSMYVLHVPLIGLLQHIIAAQFGFRQLSPAEPLHTLLYFGMLATLVLSAYLSYLLFESKTYRIRNAVKKLFMHRSAAQSARATVSTKG